MRVRYIHTRLHIYFSDSESHRVEREREKRPRWVSAPGCRSRNVCLLTPRARARPGTHARIYTSRPGTRGRRRESFDELSSMCRYMCMMICRRGIVGIFRFLSSFFFSLFFEGTGKRSFALQLRRVLRWV